MAVREPTFLKFYNEFHCHVHPDTFFSRRSTFNADRVTQVNRKHDDKIIIIYIYLFWSKLNVERVVKKIYPCDNEMRCNVSSVYKLLKDLDQL